MVLDAINLATSRHFDGIYSNKVLHQLTQEELNKSLESQFRVLNPGGIALHSLWWGEQCEDYDGMIAQHYTQESFTSQLGHRFTVLEAIRYTEMETDDSLCMILKRS